MNEAIRVAQDRLALWGLGTALSVVALGGFTAMTYGWVWIVNWLKELGGALPASWLAVVALGITGFLIVVELLRGGDKNSRR